MRIENRSALDQNSQTTLSAENTNAKRLFICNTKRQEIIKIWNEYIDEIKRMSWKEQYSHCAELQFLSAYFYIGMSTKAQMKSFRVDLNYFVLFFTLFDKKSRENHRISMHNKLTAWWKCWLMGNINNFNFPILVFNLFYYFKYRVWLSFSGKVKKCQWIAYKTQQKVQIIFRNRFSRQKQFFQKIISIFTHFKIKLKFLGTISSEIVDNSTDIQSILCNLIDSLNKSKKYYPNRRTSNELHEWPMFTV